MWFSLTVAQYTVPFSQTCLTLVVGVNDVAQTGHCKGGVILKVMDECAGIVAVKHCQNVAVTACITATNFHKLIPKGGWTTAMIVAFLRYIFPQLNTHKRVLPKAKILVYTGIYILISHYWHYLFVELYAYINESSIWTPLFWTYFCAICTL